MGVEEVEILCAWSQQLNHVPTQHGLPDEQYEFRADHIILHQFARRSKRKSCFEAGNFGSSDLRLAEPENLRMSRPLTWSPQIA